MSIQQSFFDAPQEPSTAAATPAPPAPARASNRGVNWWEYETPEQLTQRATVVLPQLPDDICLDTVLGAMGIPEVAITGKLCSCVLNALHKPGAGWQGYVVEGHSKGARYRRAPVLL